MSEDLRTLPDRFGRAVRDCGRLVGGDRIIVAVSGGLDSCVLLHLLRFHPPLQDIQLIVGHFDHGMRESSGGDARWVRGLCEAWGLRVEVGQATRALHSEADARIDRYEFLETLRRDADARSVLTAHHADDQAETVLFRFFRGTGVGGLQGIPAAREPAILRPFLGFWRDELEGYASESGVSWREDPTNRRLELARNALRHRILPDVERLVAPGARRALVRFAGLAESEEAGWESVLPGLMDPLGVDEVREGIAMDRGALVGLHPAVRARVLRSLALRLGYGLDAGATDRAVRFAAAGASGGRIELGGSLELRLELDRVVLGVPSMLPEDRPVRISDRLPGSGEALLGGVRVPVCWGGPDVVDRVVAEHFSGVDLRFPLTVRARLPGDRIRLQAGTKKLNKLFLEARIPQGQRSRMPVVVDAEDEVLWVPGVARALVRSGSGDPGLDIGVG